MSNHCISIIMPVFNAEGYVGEAIASVIDQTYRNWELLVINDGSTDKGKQVILSFNDSRVRYFEQENKGVSAARNIGLSNMQGDYFCFLDADDVMPKESLKLRLHIFKTDPKIYFVDGKVEKRDRILNRIKETYTPTYKGDPFPELVKLSNACFLGNTWMIKRKNDYKYHFNTHTTHSEDLLFYISIAEHGTYSFTDETILLYRVGNDSAMTNLDGLEQGYKALYETISAMPNINQSELKYLKRRITRIMVLSYLSAGKWGKAFQAVYSLPQL